VTVAAPAAFAEIVFRDAGQVRLMLVSAFVLGAVIAFNFFTELFTALRRSRVASTMQFAHSVVFTGAALTLVMTAWPAADAVVFAYGLACVLACVGAVSALRESSRGRRWPTIHCRKASSGRSSSPLPAGSGPRTFWSTSPMWPIAT
jgi:hypothetical protein